MSAFNQENVAAALKVTTLVSLGTYAGSTAAIACPVALGVQSLEKATCRSKVLSCILKNCQFFPVNAALVGTSAIGAYFATRGTDQEDPSFLIGAGAVALLFPYTLIFIKPINDRLLKEPEITEEDAAPLVSSWFHLHNVRSVVSLAAFGYVAYKVICK